MLPTKVPLTDEERRLLEKLGEPDSETRGYLSELYADFDVSAEKKREQRQEKKKVEEEKKNSSPGQTSAIDAHGRFFRMFHTSTLTHCEKKELTPSLRGTRKTFEDESRIIWDTQESLDYYPDQREILPAAGMIIPHGETGVFEVEDLVKLLRQEKLQDIAVIEVQMDIPYADYLVIGTTISKRQSRALAEFLRKVYKQTKYPKEPGVITEGEDCDEWKVLDFRNIVLHLFEKTTRKKYVLESLWTVGQEFDEDVDDHNKADVDLLAQHMEFVRSLSLSRDSPS